MLVKVYVGECKYQSTLQLSIEILKTKKISDLDMLVRVDSITIQNIDIWRDKKWYRFTKKRKGLFTYKSLPIVVIDKELILANHFNRSLQYCIGKLSKLTRKAFYEIDNEIFMTWGVLLVFTFFFFVCLW